MFSRRGFFTFLSGLGGAAAIARFTSVAAAPAEPPVSPASALPDTIGSDMLRVAGRVRCFDATKGYGFVAPDGGGPDILLHVTCLRAGGYQTAHEGARVDCLALRRPKGTQVFRILSMDESTALHSSLLPQRMHACVPPESDWERASVKWFNDVRGFGFLTRGEGTPDIFVHLETVRNSGLAKLRPGQVLQVRWGRGWRGVTAAELRPGWVSSRRGLSL